MKNFVLEGTVSHPDIVRAVAAAFVVREADIALVLDVADLPTKDEDKVGVELIERDAGRFLTDLTVYNAPATTNERDAAISIAGATDRACLISDDGDDPYVRLLVTPAGEVRSVRLDGDVLDEEEGFALAS